MLTYSLVFPRIIASSRCVATSLCVWLAVSSKDSWNHHRLKDTHSKLHGRWNMICLAESCRQRSIPFIGDSDGAWPYNPTDSDQSATSTRSDQVTKKSILDEWRTSNIRDRMIGDMSTKLQQDSSDGEHDNRGRVGPGRIRVRKQRHDNIREHKWTDDSRVARFSGNLDVRLSSYAAIGTMTTATVGVDQCRHVPQRRTKKTESLRSKQPWFWIQSFFSVPVTFYGTKWSSAECAGENLHLESTTPTNLRRHRLQVAWYLVITSLCQAKCDCISHMHRESCALASEVTPIYRHGVIVPRPPLCKWLGKYSIICSDCHNRFSSLY
jgi:hypothetical protein